MRDLGKFLAFFGVAFFLGTALGAAFRHLLSPLFLPVLGGLLGAAGKAGAFVLLPAFLVPFIFAKNLVVATVCFFTARPTRGVVPAVVCFLNGLVLGWLGAVLAKVGVSPWQYAAALLPHGAVELPAIFLASALGMGGAVARRFAPVAGMLLAAACIEVFVSPHVARAVGLA